MPVSRSWIKRLEPVCCGPQGASWKQGMRLPSGAWEGLLRGQQRRQRAVLGRRVPPRHRGAAVCAEPHTEMGSLDGGSADFRALEHLAIIGMVEKTGLTYTLKGDF